MPVMLHTSPAASRMAPPVTGVRSRCRRTLSTTRKLPSWLSGFCPSTELCCSDGKSRMIGRLFCFSLSPALSREGGGSVVAAGLGLTAGEAAEVGQGAVAAGLVLFDGDVFGAFPFQVFLGQCVEEAAGQAVDDFAELAAAGGEGEGEVALGPGDGDVGQTAFLVHGVGFDAGAVGQYLFLHAHDVDVGVFQAL